MKNCRYIVQLHLSNKIAVVYFTYGIAKQTQKPTKKIAINTVTCAFSARFLPIARGLSIKVVSLSLHRSYLCQNQEYKNVDYRFWYSPSNGAIAKIVLSELGLLVDGQKCETLISLTPRYRKNSRDDVYLLLFAIKWNIAKIVLRDLDLLLKVNNLKREYLWNGES